jgi:D-beta-D-heptose 7-phosphate kinase / D-beta-D-heptose 1-phosphate adenosyltransferase
MTLPIRRITQLIKENWRHLHVLVVGDIMLDRYIWGDVERISPEAPIPIVRSVRQSESPGGAANVAMNIVRLGGKATLLGFCGSDTNGEALGEYLRNSGVTPELERIPGHPTTTKLRILSGTQQMLRLDTEKTDGYSPAAYCALIEKLKSAVDSADAVVLSDYAKGALTEEVCEAAIRTARDRGIPVLVDPKQSDFRRYRGATTICPNLSELSLVLGMTPKNLDGILASAQRLVSDLDLDCLTATLGEKGIAVLRKDSQFVASAVAREVFDVSGAGDTVISTLALAVASGLQMEIAVQLANVSAGIAVRKAGAVPVSSDELMTELMQETEWRAQEKVVSLENLKMLTSVWRSAGQRIVFTNGCFDLLHIGHITLLEEARREGHRLIVAINSDACVRSLKSPPRPIVDERKRARILAALAAVDAVVIFEETTPARLIEELRPDVLVKGGDYREETVIGAKEVSAWGGRVKIVPLVEGSSTSELIARARHLVEQPVLRT